MKTILSGALALSLLAGGAFAQGYSHDGDRHDQGYNQVQMGDRHGDYRRSDDRRGYGFEHRGYGYGHHHMWRHHHRHYR